MSLFVDASALTAIIVDEEGADELIDRIDATDSRLTNGIALWETAVAVARIKQVEPSDGWLEVDRYVTELSFSTVAIGPAEAREAMIAYARYGKRSRHPAQLNMGDCFAYACARTHRARLLYKGDGFARTDLG